MANRYGLVGVTLLLALSLSGCGKTYDFGGYSPGQAELSSPATGSVNFSSLTPTRTEVEEAIGEVIVHRSREISQLPHAHPLFTVTCPTIPPLKAGEKLSCRLTGTTPEVKYPDFTVELSELNGIEAVLSVNSPSYWAHVEDALG